MTLIAVYNSDGCIGRCDAKCYNAECEECTCICGGANHGVGRKKALENTRELAESWVEKWNSEHPGQEFTFHTGRAVKQLSLFD